MWNALGWKRIFTQSESSLPLNRSRNLLLYATSRSVLAQSMENDDFRAGFFSFYDLMELQADFVKLDKQFVYTLDEKNRLDQTLKHIIAVMRLQDSEVIVEGIETAYQLKTWLDLDVDGLQGYFISKPVPSGQLKSVLSRVAKRTEVFVD